MKLTIEGAENGYMVTTHSGYVYLALSLQDALQIIADKIESVDESRRLGGDPIVVVGREVPCE